MAENKNRPPEDAVVRIDTTMVVWRYKNGKEVPKMNDFSDHYWVKDENGLWVKRFLRDYQSYEIFDDEIQELFAPLINKKKEKSTPPTFITKE